MKKKDRIVCYVSAILLAAYNFISVNNANNKLNAYSQAYFEANNKATESNNALWIVLGIADSLGMGKEEYGKYGSIADENATFGATTILGKYEYVSDACSSGGYYGFCGGGILDYGFTVTRNL